jgi:glycosidase
MLYQINTRVCLSERAAGLGRPATFDDVASAELEAIRELGFDAIWWLGVWQTGPRSRDVARTHAGLRGDYARVLPDFTDDDIVGSPFAVAGYSVHSDFGGDAALARLRARMQEAGLSLVLDFVPNHVGLDHPWVREHPEYLIGATSQDTARAPQNFFLEPDSAAKNAGRSFAHGRDPYFDGWTDTVQLNYFHAGLRSAMERELASVAARCDGVRCDMAMLLLPDVFRSTWGDLASPWTGEPAVETSFWAEVIPRIKAAYPRFQFIAEVYWDREAELLSQGFDLAYDKRLYDRMVHEERNELRQHLRAEIGWQNRLMRFLENHDEPRAAATFPGVKQRAAAMLTLFAPGRKLIHEGQLEGRRVKLPVQLARRPVEPVDASIREFYRRVLPLAADPLVQQGEWTLLDVRSAWDGNGSHGALVAMRWSHLGCEWLVTVNFAPHYSQGYVEQPLENDTGIAPRTGLVDLVDQLSTARYRREVSELSTRGLYLDLPPWGVHLFEMVGV